MMKFFSNQKGFTVLESIVAIFILSLSISGVFTSVQQSLSQSVIVKDEIKAYYLAQEAVEIIRNKRDINQIDKINNLATTNWLAGISELSTDPCSFGKICRADVVPFSLQRCGDAWDSCSNINYDSNLSLYTYNSGSETNFKREIQIESVSSTEVSVTVRVSWRKGLINREFKIKTHLFNWV